jgi:hypothetical protein
VGALVLDAWPRLLGRSNGGSFYPNDGSCTRMVVRCTSHPLHQMAGLHDNDMRRPVLRYNALEPTTCAWLRSGVCEAGPLVDVAWLDWLE